MPLKVSPQTAAHMSKAPANAAVRSNSVAHTRKSALQLKFPRCTSALGVLCMPPHARTVRRCRGRLHLPWARRFLATIYACGRSRTS